MHARPHAGRCGFLEAKLSARYNAPEADMRGDRRLVSASRASGRNNAVGPSIALGAFIAWLVQKAPCCPGVKRSREGRVSLVLRVDY
jgi:hypothetical protein